MDVFAFRDNVVKDYGQFSRSFTEIRAADIRSFVDGEYEGGVYWPSPLIQLNPSFTPGGTVEELVAAGKLHSDCEGIFRFGKQNGQPGQGLQLHRHQAEAISIAQGRRSYVLTTGTGSGKSLSYFIPIIDAVLKRRSQGDREQRISAIVIYPMNALCNSQRDELERYLCEGYKDGPKVTFARYTGQEKEEEREAIRQSPPDILLTNYVMLEYILTRQEPTDQRVIATAQGLDFLVLDELHTYRGRQGADVALLVRRVRQRLNPNLLCVGTSATMSTEGSAADRNRVVAEVASKLFGATVAPEDIVTETLDRVTFGDAPSTADLAAALASDLRGPWSVELLRQHPLARWVELELGLDREDQKPDGKWVRRKPRSIEEAGRLLSAITGLDAELAEQQLILFLLASYQVDIAPNRRFFAFRLHQFLSAGGDVYATLQKEGDRYLTLKGQVFKPGDRQSFLYPLAFCRNCGQEYYTVWASLHDKRPVGLEPREFRDTSSRTDKEIVWGYFMPDSDENYSIDDPEKANLPDGWTELDKNGDTVVKRDRQKYLPVATRFLSDGQRSVEGLHGWFIKERIRYCPSCGVEHIARSGEFTKLSGLSSEGRSSATTTLTLSVLRQLLSDSVDVADEARKLLAFSDNRQDASLQAGHFNDFIRVLQLRAGLVAALRDAPENTLGLETLAQATERALRLEANDFIRAKNVKPPIEERNRKALRQVLEYRLLIDLRKGWRLTNPNLEQLQLLEIDYDHLVECVEDNEEWANQHPLLAQASPIDRFLICHRLLDELRGRLAIDTPALSIEEFEARVRRANDLEELWGFEDNELAQQARDVLLEPIPAEVKNKGLESLSYRSAFGRWLKAAERWSSALDSFHTIKKWNEDVHKEIAGQLMIVLETWGLVHKRAIPIGFRNSQTLEGWRLTSTCLLWKLRDPNAPPLDDYAKALIERGGRRLRVNDYFRSLYADLAELIQSEGKPFLQSLRAKEHTAQVDSQEREEREKQFRAADLRVLFCSPTMELGVDISSLNTVYMRNVPPTPANYAQRSGRAGRSGQPALVLSYCGATSPHDQYFFSDPTRMVSGSVTAPTLELANEELLKAHFRALWLARTGKKLPKTVKELVDLEAFPAFPVIDEVMNDLQSGQAIEGSLADTHAILEELEAKGFLGSPLPAWYSNSWISNLIERAAADFENSIDRWRNLYNAVNDQLEEASKVFRNAALSEKDRKLADVRQKSARQQQQILLATKAGASGGNSDFSTYRYLASQGFMPGYNFPRLPLLAYIPGSRQQVDGGTFLSRPRFVGLSEFGPHSLIYHEGNTYQVTKAILSLRDGGSDPSQSTLATRDAMVCGSCGHAHLGSDAESELCCHCGALLKPPPDGTAMGIPSLLPIEQVSTRRKDRITSNDEERQRLGYDLITTFEFPRENGVTKVARSKVSVYGREVLELSYASATTISRINLGWRRRENKSDMGFPIHPITGDWGGKEQLAGDDDSADASEVGYQKITPYVQDRKNALLIRFLEPMDAKDRITLKNALKRGIEVAYQLDPSELAAELMPNDENPTALLIYESSEGGAGVLSRLVEQQSALHHVARSALGVCHWQVPEEAPENFAELENLDPNCEAGCYQCLLSYGNQREHELIDRKAAVPMQLLVDLLHGEVGTLRGVSTREQLLTELEELSQSSLEKLWLQTLYRRGLNLPDGAQRSVPGHYVVPDFVFRQHGVLIFIDGPHHERPLQQRIDEEKRAALRDAGYSVVVFDKYTESWDSQFQEYAWLFGEEG